MSFNTNRLGASSSFIASSTPPSNSTTSTTRSSRHTLGNLSTESQSQAKNPASYLNINSMKDIQAIVGKSRQQRPNLTENEIYTALTSYIERKKIHKHVELDNVLSTWAINILAGIPLSKSSNNNSKREYEQLIAEIAQAAKRQQT